jgi:hypothetical protein
MKGYEKPSLDMVTFFSGTENMLFVSNNYNSNIVLTTKDKAESRAVTLK